ncbi:single-stranded-DNA-specific exonuclease RecJ [Candidatus Falkowbacteria bacterium]|uniref:Single-stranded-DNA-specific exonuclease RecJ n=1 Tax=Candidatus Buchananbacteria bacterium CG10_big_fil_rev_8_21_14_0_10_33_19 TaxID=1974525 RepID=A0A2H0W5V7_9BACT|nr:single-stranded-DNA-specific exonuclease RecJ [Candidatus Falkowbacteria bacterium]PIS06030.1 MAG: single-stranded-DNA-specific exonuclease RecJ [Candidatus Buchananbacteria bacterium CG10_big_fil_rev_8_21_14_0_10_33_19]
MHKKWQVSEVMGGDLVKILPSENKIILQLLHNRGFDDKKSINDFLSPNYDEQVADPFLFADMKKATTRILQAIKDKEKIMIYGDYDADGVCSTAVIYSALKKLGADVDIRIPFREGEGYGLNMTAVQEISDSGYKLVVTVDCGISNKEEVSEFKKNKVDIIVTDHHKEPQELPLDAYAIINPSLNDCQYPFRKLCGAGVAFKVVQGLLKTQDEFVWANKLPLGFDKWLLDLVAIATVGDIMPLLGENRIFVKYGLIVLDKTRRKGIMKIVEKLNHFSGKLDTQYIGWRIVPRLNAAGRINHASLAFELLISDNDDESDKLVQKLEEENTRRQSITVTMMKEADKIVSQIKDDKLLLASGESWHPGVVGLVAGRISDKYNLPAIIISQDGDKYVGSGRSVNGFDITSALSECSEYLEKFGGHPQACGFTIIGKENLDNFHKKMVAIATEALKDADLREILKIEAEIELADIDWNFYYKLEKFEPFGEANDMPLFLIRNLKIEQVQTVGSDGKHLRAMVSQTNHPVIHKMIGFSFGDWCAKLNVGDNIDVVFEIGVNEWNGNKELQLKIVDLMESAK